MHEARGGAVLLGENDMTGHVKPGLFPRFDETIRLVPRVEAHAETVIFQNPVHLRKCRVYPGIVVVARDDRIAVCPILRERENGDHCGGTLFSCRRARYDYVAARYRFHYCQGTSQLHSS